MTASQTDGFVSDGYGDRPWRVGRSVGRTIYDAHDTLIGVMDTRMLAALLVASVNATSGMYPALATKACVVCGGAPENTLHLGLGTVKGHRYQPAQDGGQADG